MTRRKTILVLAVVALSLLVGCKKKKPNLPPPQATAPTITAPEPQPQPVETPPEAANPVPPTPAPAETTPAKPTAKPRPHPAARKPAPSAPAQTPPKPPASAPVEIASAKPPAPPVVPPLTRAPNPQPVTGTLLVVPVLPHDEAIHNSMTTDQLLQSSAQNLDGIKRILSADEQEMVKQIRLYIQQSRAATSEGDLVRGRNLALKAHVLSDALVKP